LLLFIAILRRHIGEFKVVAQLPDGHFPYDATHAGECFLAADARFLCVF
jgi:hypothetical protein